MNELINKEVINKNNEKGVVISIDEKHTVVNFDGVEKTFNTLLAFKIGFLKFVNAEDNKIITSKIEEIDQNIRKIKEAKEKQERETLLRNKKAYETLASLTNKHKILMQLFGNDFVYPPLEEFKKKNGSNIWQIYASGKKSHIIGIDEYKELENLNKSDKISLKLEFINNY